MARKKYTKTTAIALAAATIFQSGAMATNLLDVNAFAVERNQTNDKVEILKQGTKLASDVSIIETTPSAVGITKTADVSLNAPIEVEIPSNTSLDFQVLSIRDELSKHTILNVKISGQGLDIDTDVPLKDGQNLYECGWLIEHDNDNDDFVTLTVRTKDFSFNKDGKEYKIGSLEYTTKISLIVPNNPGIPNPPDGGTVTTPSAVELSSVEIKGNEKVGNTLSANVKDINGNEVNSDLAYKWYRVDRVGSVSETLVSTNSAYKLQNDDAYKYIKLVVSNSENSVETITGKISKKSSSGGSSSSSGGLSSSNSSNSSTSSNNNNTYSNVSVSQGSTAAMQQNADGSIKLVNAEGVPATGWQQVDGTWYLGDVNGQALKGWQQIEGKWYLMNANGAMTTGWQNVGGTWYFMSTSGAMTKGWQKVGGKWYFLQSSGAMKTGWLNDNGTWYYLNADGSMAANTYVDGYYVGSNGAWVK